MIGSTHPAVSCVMPWGIPFTAEGSTRRTRKRVCAGGCNTHTRTHTHTRTYTHAHTLSLTQHTHIHTHEHLQARAPAPNSSNVLGVQYTHSGLHTHTHTHTPTHPLAHTHCLTHAYTHTLPPSSSCSCAKVHKRSRRAVSSQCISPLIILCPSHPPHGAFLFFFADVINLYLTRKRDIYI